MPHENLESLAMKVLPSAVRVYATANGWERQVSPGNIAVFNLDNRLEQLIVPMESRGNDYARRMMDVVSNLAEIEQRSKIEVVNDLLMPNADIIRFRLSSPNISNDLSFLKGLELLEGAKKSLLASAHSALHPQRYHPRMSRLQPTQLLNACRLKQTEHGSFVVAVACPMNAIEGQNYFDEVDPFARVTTETLMKSLIHIEEKIENDRPSDIYEGPNSLISSNLCNALLKMQPPEDRGELVVSATWASTRPQNEKTKSVGASASFQSDYFEVIEEIGRRLHPSSHSKEYQFFGLVDGLIGEMDSDGRRFGEVILSVVFEDELIKLRTSLNKEDYEKAYKAHKTGEPVSFRGDIHIGRRVHQLTSIKDFLIVRTEPENETENIE